MFGKFGRFFGSIGKKYNGVKNFIHKKTNQVKDLYNQHRSKLDTIYQGGKKIYNLPGVKDLIGSIPGYNTLEKVFNRTSDIYAKVKDNQDRILNAFKQGKEKVNFIKSMLKK
jgi:hypothetical protein